MHCKQRVSVLVYSFSKGSVWCTEREQCTHVQRVSWLVYTAVLALAQGSVQYTVREHTCIESNTLS